MGSIIIWYGKRREVKLFALNIEEHIFKTQLKTKTSADHFNFLIQHFNCTITTESTNRLLDEFTSIL